MLKSPTMDDTISNRYAVLSDRQPASAGSWYECWDGNNLGWGLGLTTVWRFLKRITEAEWVLICWYTMKSIPLKKCLVDCYWESQQSCRLEVAEWRFKPQLHILMGTYKDEYSIQLVDICWCLTPGTTLAVDEHSVCMSCSISNLLCQSHSLGPWRFNNQMNTRR